jgi:putative nucleotidyltransferase with HDIG domain
MAMTLSRDAAWSLLCEWVSSDSLRRHCLAVEAAMRWQASAKSADVDLWGITGLLHDLDYERHPDPGSGHPRMAMAELERLGYPAEMVRAIGSHAAYMNIPRESELELSLAGIDELCGFVLACAYVRPQGIHGLTAKSVKKKLKAPSFAAAVSREDIHEGARLLDVSFDEHLHGVIAALQPHAAELGVDGGGSAAGSPAG